MFQGTHLPLHWQVSEKSCSHLDMAVAAARNVILLLLSWTSALTMTNHPKVGSMPVFSCGGGEGMPVVFEDRGGMHAHFLK